ncbi:MMPL family transporter [Nocardioides daejeonensis]|uniref:MMPL family transporter n=1 Tax=Nocardioides daejeonensis TaxID=1046556 RepID=UPI001EF64FD7|nr:MMPL family transporter [Nocardioides daejeonensis]
MSRLAESSARWSARHPWRAVGTWLLLIGVAVGLLMTVPTVTADGSDYWQGESGKASRMTEEAGLDLPFSESVLITGSTGQESEIEQAAKEVRREMARVDGVAAVGQAAWNPDHTAMLVDVELADTEVDVAPLQKVTAEVAEAHPALGITQAGDNSIDDAIGELVADDLRSAEITSLPVTLLLMLVAFGALIAAGIPVLLALGSVVASIGIIAPISHLWPAEQTVTSMIVLIGMAVGVDYSLFFLKRQREERSRGRSVVDAVEIAAATSGHSILVSGGAVIASMASLFLVQGVTFDSLATSAILVVAIAVVGSITVLPALLVLLGDKVNRPRLPLLWRLNRRVGTGGISRRLLGPVVRHPLAAAVLSLAFLGALAAPTLGMKVSSSGLETLPTSIPQVRTFEQIAERFPGQMLTVDVVAKAEHPQALRQRLIEVQDAAVASGLGMEPVSGDPVRVSADGRTAVLTLGIDHPEDSEEAEKAVEALRSSVVPDHLRGVADEFAVGGAAGENYDWIHQLTDRMPWVVGFIVLLTLVIMGVTFRSAAIALLSALLNLMSVGVAFGVMTLVFQHGWGSGVLDFSAPGYLIEWLPLFVMVVLVGLSMDYHVFVLSRVQEHVRAGLPSRVAVRRGIADTAGVVTSAAAVMVAVFSIFAVLSMMEMKMMGVGLAVAILVDATVIRLVALPALLTLLGERAWWPRRPVPPRGEVVEVPGPLVAART